MADRRSATADLLPRLAPLCAAMFLGFLSVSLPLPVLALYVHETLRFPTAIAGFVVGLQSLATILTRAPSGRMVDRLGPKTALGRGLLVAAVSGFGTLASAALAATPLMALAVLLVARLALGIGESLLITGVLSWALVRAGPGRSGRAMGWNGIAQYSALAAGAPLGFVLDHAFGLEGVALAAIAAPLAAWAVVRPLTPAAALGGARLPLRGVVGQIAWPGLALALAGIGFAAISTFATLDFVAHGWPGAGGALFAFGGCFVAVRVAGSGLADRVRGQILAAGSMAVACLGQTVLWIAPNGVAAIAGAGLTGLGCSLVFPALGVLAVRRVPDASRGIAIGAFAAFQDLAIGLTGPLLGAIASVWGFPAVFLGGGLAAAAGAVVSLTIAPRRAP